MAVVYVEDGEEYVVDLIDGTETTHLDSSNAYVGHGTGVTAANKADTALETASADSRALCTASQATPQKNQWVGTVSCGSTQSITEAVLFNAVSAGTAIIRGVFTSIGVDNGDSVEYTITLEQT